MLMAMDSMLNVLSLFESHNPLCHKKIFECQWKEHGLVDCILRKERHHQYLLFLTQQYSSLDSKRLFAG